MPDLAQRVRRAFPYGVLKNRGGEWFRCGGGNVSDDPEYGWLSWQQVVERLEQCPRCDGKRFVDSLSRDVPIMPCPECSALRALVEGS